MPPVIEDVKSIGAGILGAGISAVLAWFKLRRMAASDNKGTQADDAASGVITMLRGEIMRLAEQNTKLATIVNDLQLQVIDLHRQNADLRADVLRIKYARDSS